MTTPSTIDPHRWYTPAEVAPHAGYSRSVVYGWCCKGLIEHRRAPGGNHVKILGSVFLEFVARQLEQVRRPGRKPNPNTRAKAERIHRQILAM